jgi:hypothetical protein
MLACCCACCYARGSFVLTTVRFGHLQIEDANAVGRIKEGVKLLAAGAEHFKGVPLAGGEYEPVQIEVSMVRPRTVL